MSENVSGLEGSHKLKLSLQKGSSVNASATYLTYIRSTTRCKEKSRGYMQYTKRANRDALGLQFFAFFHLKHRMFTARIILGRVIRCGSWSTGC